MNKSLLINVILFSLGITIGYSLNSRNRVLVKDSEVANSKELITAQEKFDQSKVEIKEKEVSPSTVKSKSKRKYFKETNNKASKSRRLLNEINKKDHWSPDGEPNMDIIDLYEEILSNEPDNVKALAGYSNYLLRFQRLDEAGELINRCLKADPDNSLCLGNSTNYALNNGDYEVIGKKVDNCLSRTPDNPNCIHNKINIYLGNRDGENALIYTKRLDEVNGKGYIRFPKAMISLAYARSYELLKDTVNAKKYYEISCSEGQAFACKTLKK